MNNAEKIKIIASGYIESMTKAINNLAKAMNECANSLRVSAPELKKSIEKAYDHEGWRWFFVCTDVIAEFHVPENSIRQMYQYQ